MRDAADRPPRRPSYAAGAGLFLRLLGLSYLVAFLSLGVQLRGLVGQRGILPAAPYLEAVAQRLGTARFHLLPTLCWLGASDTFLVGLAVAGVLLSLPVLAGWLEVPALAALWALYLSLVTVGRDFLSFQWDNLLLEAGLVAVFLFRPALRTRLGEPPSPVALWLLRWLLFRLMFLSGVVKLASGDPSWRGLTALRFHYETQPLPTWVGWYAHQLPGWFQTASAAAMFAVELGVPFLIFLPWVWPRRIGAALLLSLQALIAATGNYGFFNLLAAILCLTLLDDRLFPRRWRRRPPATAEPTAARRALGWTRQGVVWAFAALVLVISSVELLASLRWVRAWPQPAVALYRAVAPFRSINGYGLFAVMTTERPEIVVEGSDDGSRWLPYTFRWKPGDVTRRPRFVAPHMPRLDWQMWFAALGDARQNPWFLAFLERLAEGSPEVLALLAENPFPDHPPRYLRARLYDYRFTELGSGEAWWRREERGLYVPPVESERLRGLAR